MTTPAAIASRAQFLALLDDLVKNYSVDGKLLKDFFNDPLIGPRWHSAPGSTALRFHHAWEGGLVEHVMDTLRITLEVASKLSVNATNHKDFLFTKNPNSVVPRLHVYQAVLLHDINKIGDAFGNPYYVPNILKSGAVSDKIPYATADVLFNYRTSPMEETREAKAAHAAAMYFASQCWHDVPEGEVSLAIVAAVSPALYASLSADVRFAIRHHDGAYGRARRNLQGNETPLQMILHFSDMWSSRMAKEEYR